MKRYYFVFSSIAVCFFLGSFPGSAQDTKDTKEASAGQSEPWYKRYNPAKLIKRDTKSASERLASDGDLEIKLTHQLQVLGLLEQDKNLQEVCSDFKQLADCIASLRASHTLQIEFSCLKWDVTGVKPKPVADSCAGPSGGKAMGLYRSIDLLKPDSDARTEASTALKKAHDDIKDAGG